MGTSAFSAKSPCGFGHLAYTAISIPREVLENTVLACGNSARDLCVLGLFICGACELPTASLPFGVLGCTVGIDLNPPVWPSTQAEWWRLPERQLLLQIVEWLV